jgi:hypothetical protein
MEYLNYIWIVVVLGGVIAFYVFYLKKMKQGGMSMFGGQSQTQAIERVEAMYGRLGYKSLIQDTAEQIQAKQKAGKPTETHMVRQLGPYELHYQSSTQYSGSGYSMSLCWRLPLANQARVGIHIADKSVADTSKRVARDFMTSQDTKWSAAYRDSFDSGDAQLDKRFRFFATDVRAAQALLGDQELRTMLLSLPFVDVAVHSSEVIFNDPAQKALTAAMGGPFGMMKMLTDEGVQIQERLHNNVGALLGRLAGMTAGA